MTPRRGSPPASERSWVPSEEIGFLPKVWALVEITACLARIGVHEDQPGQTISLLPGTR